MAHIALDIAPRPRFSGLGARLAARLWPHRKADKPSRFTDAELLEIHERNLGKLPVSSEAIVMISLRAGMWGRY